MISRIRWDKEFAKGQFEIGYYDRIKNEIITVPLKAVQFTEGDRYFAFSFSMKKGVTIPYPSIVSGKSARTVS